MESDRQKVKESIKEFGKIVENYIKLMRIKDNVDYGNKLHK